jgi:RimJ/RimL family protein N-acetyltransferase
VLQLQPLRACDAAAVHGLLGDRQVATWSLLQHSILAGRSEVEVGWTVTSGRWGEGLGTQMGEHALVGAAALGLHSTVAYARANNPASRRIMEKLGFTFEQAFDHNELPHVLYRKPLTGELAR